MVWFDPDGLPECGVCGRKIHTKDQWSGPFTCELESGTTWSDLIGVGSTGPRVLVSERVAEKLGEFAPSLEFHEIEITQLKSKKLRLEDAPQYYVMSWQRRYILLREKSGLTTPLCPTCQAQPIGDDMIAPKSLVTETAIAEDVFAFGNFMPGGSFCSERVVQLAHDEGWINFRFMPFDANPEDTFGWKGVDYASPAWRQALYPPRRKGFA